MTRTAIAIVLLVPPLASVRAQEADEATKLAVKLTTEGAETFNTKNAGAMAAYYTDDAQILLVSKDKDSGLIKHETKTGRAEIEAYYGELFKDKGTIHSKNTVEYARKIDPDILLIGGVFEPDLTGDGFKVPFVQVRQRHGDRWLMSSLQIFIIPQ